MFLLKKAVSFVEPLVEPPAQRAGFRQHAVLQVADGFVFVLLLFGGLVFWETYFDLLEGDPLPPDVFSQFRLSWFRLFAQAFRRRCRPAKGYAEPL